MSELREVDIRLCPKLCPLWFLSTGSGLEVKGGLKHGPRGLHDSALLNQHKSLKRLQDLAKRSSTANQDNNGPRGQATYGSLNWNTRLREIIAAP